MSRIINGKKITIQKQKVLARKIASFKKKTGRAPALVAFQVGNDSASKRFLVVKKRAAQAVGIRFKLIKLPASASAQTIIKTIKEKNKDKTVDGILVQLPLPNKLTQTQKANILAAVDPVKDVDCLTTENKARLAIGQVRYLPAVVKAIMLVIAKAKVKIVGARMTIVGQGQLVGQPLAIYLRNLGAKVTLVDEFTPDLAAKTKPAQVLVVATGRAGLIKAAMVKPGALVIDVGSPQAEVDFAQVKKVAGAITPVPGGIGPLTVVSLLENVLQAAQAN